MRLINAQIGPRLTIDADNDIVGAPGADGAQPGQGAAYVFGQPPSGWASGTETAKHAPGM